MRPVNRGDKPAHVDYVDQYSYLRKELILRLGEYCSYCETPLGANLAVEHIIAKTKHYDDTDWDNLALACVNCNSRKKDKVTESNVEIYYWPTLAYPGINTFDLLQYVQKPRTLQSLIDDGLLTIPPKRPNAQKYINNQDTYNLVWVDVNPTYQQIAIKIRETINLCGLNDYIPEKFQEKVSDRRVANRTTAWFRAISAADMLEKYFKPYNDAYTAGNAQTQGQVINEMNQDQYIVAFRKQIRYMAIATGFWSVWMTIFKARTFINDNVRRDLLRELFGVQAFPGTNYPYFF